MFTDSQKDQHHLVYTSLPGRDNSLADFEPHAALGTPIEPPYPPHFERALFGMGRFWHAEKVFWQISGVYTTAVGYGAGVTPNPTYEEVCSGRTGHNELVVVVYDPKRVGYCDLLNYFWQNHNPIDSSCSNLKSVKSKDEDFAANREMDHMRSGIYPLTPEQHFLAKQSIDYFREKPLVARNIENFQPDSVTTELVNHPPFYFAEQYHQQYLAKNHAEAAQLPFKAIKTSLM